MKSRKGQIADVVAKGGAGFRALLLHGPDEGASRALAETIGKALPDAARIDLTGAVLKADPARLADEAASASLFGGRTWIRVDGAGDESVPAVAALTDLPAADNPVVLLAGQLKKTSKLLTFCEASPLVLAHASYVPEGREAIDLVFALARSEGLELDREQARTLHEASGGDRTLLGGELVKFALYLDAAPSRPKSLDDETVLALSEGQEAEVGRMADALLDRDAARVIAEGDALAASGVEGITVTRALLRALLPLARMRAAVDGGSGVDAVLAAERVHFRRADALRRQLGRWRGAELSSAVEGVVDAELDVMTPGGLGPLAATAALPRLVP